MKSSELEKVENEYFEFKTSLDSAAVELKRQVSSLLRKDRISVAVPVESRVKDWSSIREKIERKNLDINSSKELNDLVGLRIIVLFSQDVDRALARVERTFSIVDKEDKRNTVSEDQFGYLSVHCVGYLPGGWLALPTLSDLSNVKIEIQVRTIAQHLWAAASHLLQYKREENIPPSLRRSVHRMSALLEVVDLEFDRVLSERDEVRRQTKKLSNSDLLNVDNIELILDDVFPLKNKTPDSESYYLALEYYRIFNLDTVGMFKKILHLGSDAAIKHDQSIVNGYQHKNLGIDEERIKLGVYYNHGALAIQALAHVIERNDDPVDKSLALSMRKAKTEMRITDYLANPTEVEKENIEQFFEAGALEEAIESRGMRFGLSSEDRSKVESLTRKINVDI